MIHKTLILLTGPTASGKTSLAIRLALKFDTSIISADSRQCYREMNIGVARPSSEELAAVKHYFINSHSIHQQVNAATFAEYAQNAAAEIFAENDVAIVAGGTGLYIKAFLDGLDEIPDVPAEIRAGIIREYKEKGLEWLQEEVKRNDAHYYNDGEIQNPQRLMRALEIKLGTGRSIKEFQQATPKKSTLRGDKVTRNYRVVKYALDIPRDQLYGNINMRVDRMMKYGLLDEVKSLLPFRKLNALQTVGYAELFDHLDGKLTLDEAVEKIKLNTRHYAKRQLTWFRKDGEINWVSAESDAENFIVQVCG